MISSEQMATDLSNLKAYIKFKDDIELITVEGNSYSVKETVKFNEIIDILNTFPTWLLPYFIELVNILAENNLIKCFEALIDGYVEKNTLSKLYQLLSLPVEAETFNEPAKTLLLVYGIKNLEPDFCQVLIEKHHVSPNSMLIINSGNYEEYSGSMIHFLKYDHIKKQEFIIILKLLLDAGANIFSTADSRYFDTYWTFISTLSQEDIQNSGLLKIVIPILFDHGLGFLKSEHRFPGEEIAIDEKIDSLLTWLKNDSLELDLELERKFTDEEISYQRDLCDSDLIKKMITAPIAIKIQMKNAQNQWIFSIDELKILLKDYDDFSIPQKKRIDNISKFIREADGMMGTDLFADDLENTFRLFHKTRKARLMTTAFELHQKHFPNVLSDLVINYIDEQEIVKEFRKEQSANNIRCCIQ